ncbi:FG-GAP repeat protein [Streptomyces sp. NPDC006668]|uniref:FG-GAP repeat protein n=1 Tax=Streptomyces sp. NPDC006668 TaxID=3156903 RepID=UPI0033F850B1
MGVAFGSKTGVHVARHQVLSRAYPGVPGEPRADDRFGSALALGDMDGDGHADLVVGASGATAGDVLGAGSVTVVFGARGGLSYRAIGISRKDCRSNAAVSVIRPMLPPTTDSAPSRAASSRAARRRAA